MNTLTPFIEHDMQNLPNETHGRAPGDTKKATGKAGHTASEKTDTLNAARQGAKDTQSKNVSAKAAADGVQSDSRSYEHHCVPCRQKNAADYLAGNTPGVMAAYAPETASHAAQQGLQSRAKTANPPIKDLAAEDDETVLRLVEWREESPYG